MTAYSTIEEGIGYGEFVDFVTMDGSFALAASFDLDWKIAYVYFKGDKIRSWNFTNLTSVTNRSWDVPGAPCPFDGTIDVLQNHTVVASCGSAIHGFSSIGEHQFAIAFSEMLWSFDVAAVAGLVVGGIGAGNASRVEFRNLSTGTLESTLPVGSGEHHSRIIRVTTSPDGAFVGVDYAPGSPRLYDRRNGTERIFGPGWGAIDFATQEGFLWILKDGGGLADLGQLFQYSLTDLQNPSRILDMTSIPTLDAAAHAVVYISPDGSEAGYPTILGTELTYSDNSSEPGTEERAALVVLGAKGSQTKGMGLPGNWSTRYAVEVVGATIAPDGGVFAVSLFRTALHGSETWLTYGVPGCQLPRLVFHNATA